LYKQVFENIIQPKVYKRLAWPLLAPHIGRAICKKTTYENIRFELPYQYHITGRTYLRMTHTHVHLNTLHYIVQFSETNFHGEIVPRTDFEFLAKFIRVKDYDLEKAFKRLKKYYECIYKHMDSHYDIRTSQFAYAYDSKAYTLFKHRFNGVITGVIRTGMWEPKKLPLLDIQKAALFGAEEYLNHVEVQENGVIVIVDYAGTRFEHFWHATIKEIRQCAEVILVIINSQPILFEIPKCVNGNH